MLKNNDAAHNYELFYVNCNCYASMVFSVLASVSEQFNQHKTFELNFFFCGRRGGHKKVKLKNAWKAVKNVNSVMFHKKLS